MVPRVCRVVVCTLAAVSASAVVTPVAASAVLRAPYEDDGYAPDSDSSVGDADAEEAPGAAEYYDVEPAEVAAAVAVKRRTSRLPKAQGSGSSGSNGFGLFRLPLLLFALMGSGLFVPGAVAPQAGRIQTSQPVNTWQDPQGYLYDIPEATLRFGDDGEDLSAGGADGVDSPYESEVLPGGIRKPSVAFLMAADPVEGAAEIRRFETEVKDFTQTQLEKHREVGDKLAILEQKVKALDADIKERRETDIGARLAEIEAARAEWADANEELAEWLGVDLGGTPSSLSGKGDSASAATTDAFPSNAEIVRTLTQTYEDDAKLLSTYDAKQFFSSAAGGWTAISGTTANRVIGDSVLAHGVTRQALVSAAQAGAKPNYLARMHRRFSGAHARVLLTSEAGTSGIDWRSSRTLADLTSRGMQTNRNRKTDELENKNSLRLLKEEEALKQQIARLEALRNLEVEAAFGAVQEVTVGQEPGPDKFTKKLFRELRKRAKKTMLDPKLPEGLFTSWIEGIQTEVAPEHKISAVAFANEEPEDLLRRLSQHGYEHEAKLLAHLRFLAEEWEVVEEDLVHDSDLVDPDDVSADSGREDAGPEDDSKNDEAAAMMADDNDDESEFTSKRSYAWQHRGSVIDQAKDGTAFVRYTGKSSLEQPTALARMVGSGNKKQKRVSPAEALINFLGHEAVVWSGDFGSSSQGELDVLAAEFAALPSDQQYFLIRWKIPVWKAALRTVQRRLLDQRAKQGRVRVLSGHLQLLDTMEKEWLAIAERAAPEQPAPSSDAKSAGAKVGKKSKARSRKGRKGKGRKKRKSKKARKSRNGARGTNA